MASITVEGYGLLINVAPIQVNKCIAHVIMLINKYSITQLRNRVNFMGCYYMAQDLINLYIKADIR